MLLAEVFFSVIWNKLISLLQFILVYIVLSIPIMIVSWLYTLNEEAVLGDYAAVFFIIITAVGLYGLMIKYMNQYIGYIIPKSGLVSYILMAFLFVFFAVTMNTIMVQYLNLNFGLQIHESSKQIVNIDIALLITLGMFLITLLCLAYRLITHKYVYRNLYKEKSTEELKAVLSPAAMKAYEKKEDITKKHPNS